MSDELKPCPFCGGKAEWRSGGPGCSWITCTSCPAETADGSIRRIRDVWNTRTNSIPSPEALIRAALEVAAEKAKNKLDQKQLFKEAQSVSDAIRALKDDLAAIRKAAEGRG